MSQQPLVVVAYHSGFGHTARLAEAVRNGAAESSDTTAARVAVDTITDEQWAALDAADAIVFGSPTYLGDVSAAFKTFVESTSSRWKVQAWEGKLAAGFVNSGSKSGDKLHALQSMSLFAAQHGMTWVSLGLLPGWNTSTGSEYDLNRLGFWLGAAAQSNSDEGPDAVHKADLATAAHLGRRVAEAARVLTIGRHALRSAAG